MLKSTRPALAAVIRAVRSSLGLTQEGLAHATSRTYVAKIENAQSTPTLDKFSELADALGVSPVALLSLVIATRDNVPSASLLAQAAAELEALEGRISAADIAEQLDGIGVLKRPAARPVNVVKLKNVLQCKASGLSQSETARQLGISRSTVSFLWKRSLPAEE
ncbi:helix-turn-helix domain-containing protein [Pseudomonas sp. NEEL19]|uniref:helix-turn-helix domain-containing protein n=1 Tax=Pseudomonas sp. NEEL19 TaxID=2867409 RepID=UPI00236778CA|nr:helix-turn-helix domain-containing protein [Pseudomonas sp. NEEL19]